MKINFEPRLERAWVALGVGIVSVAGKLIVGNQQNKAADKAQDKATTQLQQAADYGQTNLANAQQAYGGRMAGAESLERNIQANSANTTAANARGATSGSQFLAAQAANQGQADQADQNLQVSEAQNKYGLLNNLNLANQSLSNLYSNQGNNKQNQANSLGSSSLANYFGAFNDATSLSSMAVQASKNRRKPDFTGISDSDLLNYNG